MTRRSNRTSLARKRWRELEYLLYFSASQEPLDASPVWADSRAHRATHVASDLIERPAHGGGETRGGVIPAGGSLRAALRGRAPRGRSGQQPRKGLLSSIPHRRHGRLESVRLAQRRRNGSISEIPVEGWGQENSQEEKTSGRGPDEGLREATDDARRSPDHA